MELYEEMDVMGGPFKNLQYDNLFLEETWNMIRTLDDFKNWVKHLHKFGYSENVTMESSTEMEFRLYTETNVYTITALKTLSSSYLGCIVTNRKQRVGEDWTRSNDLHDGLLTFATWYGILTDIIAYEAIKAI